MHADKKKSPKSLHTLGMSGYTLYTTNRRCFFREVGRGVECVLVGACEDRDAVGLFASVKALPFGTVLCVLWETTHGELEVLFDLLFILVAACPVDFQEATLVFRHLLEGVVIFDAFVCIFFAKCQGLVVQSFVNFVEEFVDMSDETVDGDVEHFPGFPWEVALCDDDAVLFDIARSDFDAKGYTTHLPVVVFEPWCQVIAVVELDTDTSRAQLLVDFLCHRLDLFAFFFFAPDGDHDSLDGGDFWGQAQSLIVTVCHDDRTDKACTYTP